jgi:hypothetical protein
MAVGAGVDPEGAVEGVGDGAGVAFAGGLARVGGCRSATHVRAPTTPSVGSPRRRWKAMTAARVIVPNSPVGVTWKTPQ